MNSSLIPSRSSTFSFNNFVSKLRHVLLTFFFLFLTLNLAFTLLFKISLFSSSFYKCELNNITNITNPKLYMSDLWVSCCSFLTSSGEFYTNVPLTYLLHVFSIELAKPKSISLALKLESKTIFSGLISLWLYPNSYRILYDLRISLNINLQHSSDNPLDLEMIFNRSP